MCACAFTLHPPFKYPKCSVVVYSCSVISFTYSYAFFSAFSFSCGVVRIEVSLWQTTAARKYSFRAKTVQVCMSVDGFAYMWEYFLSTSYAHHSFLFSVPVVSEPREKTPFYFIYLALFRSPAVICRVVLVAYVCACCRRFFISYM